MTVTIRRVFRPKRKAGERANLTLEKISAASFDVLEETGLDDFSARLVAKKLGVSPAAIYAHFEGGLKGLKQGLVFVTLRSVARPYGPGDTPAGYLRELFLRMLKAVHGKQALAQLIALELSKDHLICPVFLERLLSVALGAGKPPANPARALDLALAALLGMIMVEGETTSDDKAAKAARQYSSRITGFPPSEFPTLLATRNEMMLQIKRRLVPVPAHLAKTAGWYAEPIIAALDLTGGAVEAN